MKPEEKARQRIGKLITSIALGNRDEDTITSLAGRLARMEREVGEKDKKEIEKASGGRSNIY